MAGEMIFKQPPGAREPMRQAIDKHYRADETACVHALLGQLELGRDSQQRVEGYARKLVEAVRKDAQGTGGLDAFLHEYGLSTQEGVLLMCIAEALLRVPDDGTREKLIRDKLAGADWEQHLGHSRSLFVNASTWALMLTGRVVRMHNYRGRSPDAALRRLVARLGEPVVRESVNTAMRIMGRQFVMGRTIENAIERAKSWEARGYSYSYDMLGEAARTMDDAKRYFAAYRHAIEVIGKAAKGKGVVKGPGISVKLSALHPRYELGQAKRVMDELLPRLRALAVDAARYDIGLNIDAEEADRLDISLDAIEAISGDPDLAGWDGFGVVVQAYQKRAPFVLDWLAEVARKHKRRFMVRLVKGAYWDMEIKRAQELGLPGYPVFTRKASTDVSYLACARKLFDNMDAFYPQLATHNAHSIASVLEFAGGSTDFEFQRLHGMGESLYEQVIERDKKGVGCRIYAPVGQHEDLLAYLVRRLLENGANSSFVNRIQDEKMPIDEIIADPIATVRGYSHVPHPRIPLPRDLYGPERPNARGIDLSDRSTLAELAKQMSDAEKTPWSAGPIVSGKLLDGDARDALSPSNLSHVIGQVADAGPEHVERALKAASKAAPDWAATPVEQRADCLMRAADLMEQEMPALMAICVREAGKTMNDAVAEIREAIDFCRYYAIRAKADQGKPIQLRAPAGRQDAVMLRGGGVFTCISPWNFPFAIFNGQVVAALVSGNAVIAKPAEQTPLVAAAAVRLLHRAGIPEEVLHLLPGDGAKVGGALVADPRVSGVCFTGSTEVARIINRTLAKRDGEIPPLIAETGGQNCMIVDSTALPEQVARDVLISAFQSAGQRCSALRVLYVQADVADKMIDMIGGAMEELNVSDPALLSTDIGPVIDEEAQSMLDSHVKRMLGEAKEIKRTKLGSRTGDGTFVAPAAFEIDSISRLQREVFGPVLHVVRYRADRLAQVMQSVNATGYGLTLGCHTRIDETWREVFDHAEVGNIYVNRNQIGAIVGVQPFGGQGLSGTGPKAGGPQYLRRFVAERPANGKAGDGRREPAGTPETVEPTVKCLAKRSLFDALEAAGKAVCDWERAGHAERAEVLEEAADRFQRTGGALKALSGDVKAEARAGADYLRTFAAQVQAEFARSEPLPGPTGERNEISLHPRGVFVCMSAHESGGLSALIAQIGAALAAGNTVLAWHADPAAAEAVVKAFRESGVPEQAVHAVAHGADASLADLVGASAVAGVAFAGPREMARAINRTLAATDGPIRQVIVFHASADEAADLGQPLAASPHYMHRFVHERSLSIDTTASGGNASLLSIDDSGAGQALPGEGG